MMQRRAQQKYTQKHPNYSMLNAPFMQRMLVLLIAVLVLPSAAAFGIKPAQHAMQFTPNLQYEGQFDLVRDTTGEGMAVLSTEGDLALFINFPEQRVRLSGEIQSIRYSLQLPDALAPGTYAGKIIVREEFDADKPINSQVRITYKVLVTVPGKSIPDAIPYVIELRPFTNIDAAPELRLNTRTLTLAGLLLLECAALVYALLIIRKRNHF